MSENKRGKQASTSTMCVLGDELYLLSSLTYPKVMFFMRRDIYTTISFLLKKIRNINYLVAIKAISNIQTVSEINPAPNLEMESHHAAPASLELTR